MHQLLDNQYLIENYHHLITIKQKTFAINQNNNQINYSNL